MRRLALLPVLLALASCGGSSAPSISEAVVDASPYEAAVCEKVGIMVFVGEREDVYGCAMFDRAADLATYGEGYSNAQRCFVVVEGSATDVTDAFDPVLGEAACF